MSPIAATKTLFAAALLSASLFSGAAYARDPVFSAKLAAPVAETTRLIAQNTIWTCAGDTCLARPNHAATVRACRQFVREAGAPVLAYGPADRPLTDEELGRCNANAPQAQQARN